MAHSTISTWQYIELLKQQGIWIADQGIEADSKITGKPVTDSRQIRPGDAFICIKGFQTDGHAYVDRARESGAGLIVYENSLRDPVTGIQVTDSRKAAALLAKLYYDNPTGKLVLIGVTGTNGKTTTSMLIWQALTFLGNKTGWIGTLGYTIEGEIVPTQNTTPDIMELNSILAAMAVAGCRYVVMEVSSHALALDRVYGLEFDYALFSNLTREHLDFHKDMAEYFKAKYQLFEQLQLTKGAAIINIDDEYGRKIYDNLNAASYKNTVTVSEQKGDYTISDISCSSDVSSFILKHDDNHSISYETQLIGHFNVLNCALATITLNQIFPSLADSLQQEIIKELKSVRGRLEKVGNDKGLGIFVDYAHTPDALKNVLETLCKLPHKRMITVFGAGGDRDKGKRPEMLRCCLKYSDAVIITDDNPRTEDPNQIIRDIIGDNPLQSSWWIIRNRFAAIRSALRLSTAGDLILIAGKGHETYQEFKDERHQFDDVETARNLMIQEYGCKQDELILPVESLLLELLFDTQFASKDNAKKSFRYISTDSRKTGNDTLFFALKGERFNGMDFVQEVLQNKSCGAVITYPDGSTYDNTIRVADTTVSLGILSQKYLAMFSPRKIALTGSTGKTTTKEFLANIFEQEGHVLKTYENENNIIGLSKTIFRIKPEDTTAVFELGTNHFGEIRQLADVCRPDIAIITNIGPAHLEFFGDEAGVYKEKTDLFRRNLSLILYPGDDPRFNEFQDKGVSVGFGDSCHYKIAGLHTRADSLEFTLNDNAWSVPQPVPFYVTNVCFAIAAAFEAGLSKSQIRAGLNKPIRQKMRMEIRKMQNRQFIIDCYNANPVSMKSAIQFWKSYNKEVPHVAILGDMLELGEQSVEYHKNVGQMLEEIDFDILITIGEMSRYYNPSNYQTHNRENQQFLHFSNVEELIKQSVSNLLPANSVVLIKASHSMNLEKLLDAV